jgi:DNA-binding MarR family transcriptional regulator
MVDRQCTFGELDNLQTIKGLTENQRKIVSLINCGLNQALIAQRLGFSRSYINQVIKRLLSFGLIQRIETHPSAEGKREYTHFYQLSPELKGRVAKNQPEEPFTACRVHNLRMKVKIISQSAPVSTDKRASYSKSWQMRGGARHKFWFSGKAGMPSVTLDIHPKTIVAYVDKKQTIVAKTPQEAEDIGWRSIYQALDKFIELQSRFGIQIDVAHTGTVIGKPHGGFVGTDSRVMEEGVRTKEWWIDRSQEAELGPGHPELETTNKDGMTRLDNLIKVSEQVDLIKLPEMFKDIVNPIAANVLQVQAMMQGGITISQQYEKMLNFMTHVMNEMAEMRKENAELKAKLGII